MCLGKMEPRTRQICRAREIILFKFPSVGNLNHLELKFRGTFAALSSRTRTAAHTREGSRGGRKGSRGKYAAFQLDCLSRQMCRVKENPLQAGCKGRHILSSLIFSCRIDDRHHIFDSLFFALSAFLDHFKNPVQEACDSNENADYCASSDKRRAVSVKEIFDALYCLHV